jgi:sugar phosphate isomerase/epimerase
VKFAYSTNAFKRYPLEEAIELIKEIGFDAVEIMADRPHLYPPDYGPEKLPALKKKLDALGLAVSNLNTFTLCAVGDMHHPSWIEKDEKQRQVRIQHTRNCLALAKKLDCANISIQPGGRVEHFSQEDAMEIFLAGLTEVVPDVRQLGVKILVEPEPGLLMESASQFEQFLPSVDAAIIGLNCDVGHFYCAGDEPAEVIRRFANVIGHVHIEDIKNRVHNHLICGHGDIDFAPIFAALREINYQGFVSVELYPYQDNPVEAGRESLRFLRQFV